MEAPKPDNNVERPYDEVINVIVDYAYNFNTPSDAALVRAKATLLDALGVAIESLKTSEECAALVGPLWPRRVGVVSEFHLPGAQISSDLLKGAFDLGAMIRYLDHNDAFAGAEWGHPSDNIGAILATADILSRQEPLSGGDGSRSADVTMSHVLLAMIKAYEIQGCFQEHNAFNRVGLDHTILVKVASTAAVSWLMGLTIDQARSAVSHAWADGHPLRVFRQAPNAGPRKGWAAGDACTSLARAGQPGLRTVLTDPRWGFYHTLYKDMEFILPRPFGCWVMENIVFKITTAEGHGLTAVEAALDLVNQLEQRNLGAGDIKSIHVRTQKPAMVIINKQGPLHNAADRDHCLRYMVAVILIKGSQIETADYQNDSPWATDERVDELRSIISMEEEEQFTRDYHDSAVRSCTNVLEVTMKDGTRLESRVDFPLGHARREETLSAVKAKAVQNLGLGLPAARVSDIVACMGCDEFDSMRVSAFTDMFQV